MKILIVSFYYYPEMGAAPSRITNMAEGLRDSGAEVEVLTCLPNYPKGKIFDGYRGKFSCHETINGIKVHRYWTYATISKNPFARVLSMFAFGFTMWSMAFKRRLVKSYDRVIIQSPPILVAYSAVLLFKCLFHCTTVLNVSDLWPLSAVELGAVKEGSLMHKMLLKVEKFLYRHVSAIQGQSQEIIVHINSFKYIKPVFLYRNLQHDINVEQQQINRRPLKIVYAGLLGVAQDILGIVKNIDFRSIGAEFHIYGGGNQTIAIENYIKDHDTSVFYHGYLDKQNMVKELLNYHVSIVPLAVHIHGAVPSKIFDLMPVGIPILFCGGGEGAHIVEDYNLGYCSKPGDYKALHENIIKLANLSEDKYSELKNNCLNASKTDFSFNGQMKEYYSFITTLS